MVPDSRLLLLALSSSESKIYVTPIAASCVKDRPRIGFCLAQGSVRRFGIARGVGCASYLQDDHTAVDVEIKEERLESLERRKDDDNLVLTAQRPPGPARDD